MRPPRHQVPPERIPSSGSFRSQLALESQISSTHAVLDSQIGSTQAALNAQINSTKAALEAQIGSTGPQFVSANIMTVAQVLTSHPAGAANRGKYVRVSDLYGFIDGVMRCGLDSATGVYFWQPTTPEYGRTITVAGNVSFGPLTSPTSIVLAGALGGLTRTVTLTTANGRPGEIKEIRNGMTGLGTLNLAGTGIGSALALVLGAYRKFMLDFSTGTPTWVQLV